MDPDLVWAWARAELNTFTGEVCGAKLDYDLDGLANHGIQFPRETVFHDVQIAEPLLDEWRLQYSLDVLAKEYVGEGKVHAHLREVMAAHGFKTETELKQNLYQLPASDVGEYAEGDVDLPLRIFPFQQKKLSAEGLDQIYTIERKLLPVLVAMRRRGVRVDISKTEEVKRLLDRERAKWLAVVRRFAGPKAELLEADSLIPTINERGLHVTYTKKKGDVQIDKGFFERNRGDEFVRALAAGRRANTLGIFVQKSIIECSIKGRIHCEFNQLKGDKDEEGGKKGTIARLSATNPNLQAVAKRKGEFDDALDLDGESVVQAIRGLFIPEEGEDWERKDASQIEYRLLTHYARGPGAKEAREAYNNDPKTDFHKMVASMLGADPEDKEKRTRVKNTNFAKVYNAGIPRIAYTFGCSEEEAERFLKEYDAKAPFVSATNKAMMAVAAQRGYMVTILGRRARFNWEPRSWELRKQDKIKRGLPLAQAKARWGENTPLQYALTHAAMNRMFQGGCADIVKKSLVDCSEAGINDVLGPFLLTVHDEDNASVPRTLQGDQAAKEARHIMENGVKLRVPIMAEVDRGTNWGECS